MAEDERRDGRRPDGTEAQPGCGDFQETLGGGIKARNLAPGVKIGVPGSPIMVLASDPIVHADRLTIEQAVSSAMQLIAFAEIFPAGYCAVVAAPPPKSNPVGGFFTGNGARQSLLSLAALTWTLKVA
jgi:hypothetical protein